MNTVVRPYFNYEALERVWTMWCEQHGFAVIDADELVHVYGDRLTKEQRHWINQFRTLWDAYAYAGD